MTTLSIGARLMLGFALMSALAIALGLFSLGKQSDLREFSIRTQDKEDQILSQILDIGNATSQMRSLRELAVTEHMLLRAGVKESDPADVQQQWRQQKDRTAQLLGELQATVREHLSTAEEGRAAALWQRADEVVQRLLATLTKGVVPQVERRFELVGRGELRELTQQVGSLNASLGDFDDGIDEIERLTRQLVNIGRDEGAKYSQGIANSIFTALAVVVLLGVACSIVIQRSITHPLSKFMHFVQKVGTGDLTQRIEVYGDDEVARMGRSLNDMVDGLRDVAQQTREATLHLSSATAEILASTQQQAASSAQQASATQETNATMEEVRQSGSQIAERAKQVAAGAELTSTRSAAGLTAVQDTNQVMERIREQAEAVAENVVLLSEKTQVVGEIIATVNDIAEQSHLLALNAAIEAATAGEHGRGFFVVANEIKNLADQSKEATTQVRTILGDIQKGINSSVMLTEEAVKRVDAGKQQSDIANRTIHDLTANVTESIQVFQQIVAGTGQQQIGFDQVVNALNDIGQATEQTAVGTHQLEKAAANLNAISAQLRKAVERYKV